MWVTSKWLQREWLFDLQEIAVDTTKMSANDFAYIFDRKNSFPTKKKPNGQYVCAIFVPTEDNSTFESLVLTGQRLQLSRGREDFYISNRRTKRKMIWLYLYLGAIENSCPYILNSETDFDQQNEYWKEDIFK